MPCRVACSAGITNFRYWLLADIKSLGIDFRYAPQSGQYASEWVRTVFRNAQAYHSAWGRFRGGSQSRRCDVQGSDFF